MPALPFSTRLQKAELVEVEGEVLIRGDYDCLKSFIPRLKAQKIWVWDGSKNAWVAARNRITKGQLDSLRQMLSPSSEGFTLVTTVEFESEMQVIKDLGLKSYPFESGMRFAGSPFWPLEAAGLSYDPVYKMWVAYHTKFNSKAFRKALPQIKQEVSNIKGWKIYEGKKTFPYSGIIVTLSGTMISALGETYEVRYKLRDLGFIRVDKLWTLSMWRESPRKYAEIMKTFEAHEASVKMTLQTQAVSEAPATSMPGNYPTKDQIRYAQALVSRIGPHRWEEATGGNFGSDPPKDWFQYNRSTVSFLIDALKKFASIR